MYHKTAQKCRLPNLGKFENFRSKNGHTWSFPDDIALLGCISTIIDFDVSCTLWVFQVDVPLMEKPSC